MSRAQPSGHELRVSAFRGDDDYVRTLLTNGADVNAANLTNGETALHKACVGNKLNVISVLIQYGADPNAATIGGFTPLHFCVGRAAAQILLAGGADPSQSGQGVCHAIGGQKGLYELAGPVRAHRLNGRSDVAAFIQKRAEDAAKGTGRREQAPHPPGGVLYMSPQERRQQLSDQQKDWLVDRVLSLEVELDRNLRTQTAELTTI